MVHLDRREAVKHAGFEMQDFAGVGGDPGTAAKGDGEVSFECAKAESAGGAVGPLPEFDEPSGLAVP